MDLSSCLCELIKEAKVKFTLCGATISCGEVFAATGLLPALVQRADQLCSLCLGYGMGATLVEAEDSLLGVKVEFDEITPDILRLAYIYDVILAIMPNAATSQEVPLDELLYE